MKVTLLDRWKAVFARDEYDYWWQHFTDEEKDLHRMRAWELAEIIANEGKDSAKGIAAEHFLNVRIAKMQARATYYSIFFGLVGIVVGVILDW